MQDYKQMELDTRKELTKAVEALTAETIGSVEEMILRCGESPAAVRNRHETYGIAAEQLAKIQAIVKSIKNDCGTLLGTLSDPATLPLRQPNPSSTAPQRQRRSCLLLPQR